jgi:hypothetical protein
VHCVKFVLLSDFSHVFDLLGSRCLIFSYIDAVIRLAARTLRVLSSSCESERSKLVGRCVWQMNEDHRQVGRSARGKLDLRAQLAVIASTH